MSEYREGETCPKAPINATWATHQFYRPLEIRWLSHDKPAYLKRCARCGLEVPEEIPNK